MANITIVELIKNSKSLFMWLEELEFYKVKNPKIKLNKIPI